ncbi:MAG: 2TM domain-containing protein [Thermoproteota archaeon]
MVMKKEKHGFTMHAIMHAGVNAALVASNLLTVPQVLWFVFPLFSCGIGRTWHALFWSQDTLWPA